MNTQTKIILAGFLAVLIFALSVVIYYQQQMINELKMVHQDTVAMRQFQDGTTRASSSYATKDDVERIIKKNGIDLGTVKKDIRALGGEIEGVQRLLVKTPGIMYVNVPSTSTSPNTNPSPPEVECPDGTNVSCPDPFGYLSNRQVLQLSEPFSKDSSVPFGEVGFSSWKEKPWDVKVQPREYKVTNVLSTDENGRHQVYSRFVINTGGKDYPVEISNSDFVQKLPDAKLRFSPRLYIGLDGGALITNSSAELTPSVQLSLLSHGQTKKNPTWTFVNVGVGYETQEKKAAVILAPVNFNVGKVLPLVDNLHVGPSVAVDNGANLFVGGGLRLGL